MEGEGLEDNGGRIIISFRSLVADDALEVSFQRKAVNGRDIMDRSS
jgi:hypothetical protein